MTLHRSVTLSILVVILTVVATLTNHKADAQRTLPSPVVDICLQFSDNCPSCISTDSCGFCQESGLCLTGDVNGPGGNPNNCTDWFFLECPASPCSAFTNCLSCVADSLCGWCFDTLICEPGSNAGPISGTCRNFAFGNPNLCNPSRSNSRSRSRRPRTSANQIRTTANQIRTTANQIRTTAKRQQIRTTAKRRRSTGQTRSNSPTPSLIATSSAASFPKPIYLFFYLLIAVSSITLVVAQHHF